MNKTEVKQNVNRIVGVYTAAIAAATAGANKVLFQDLEKLATSYGPMTEKQFETDFRPAFLSQKEPLSGSMLSQIKVFLIAKSHGIKPVKADEGRPLDTFSGYVAAARKPLAACKSARMTSTGRNSNKGAPKKAKRQPRQPVAVAKTFDRNAFESMAGFLLDAPHAKVLANIITETTARAALVKYLDSVAKN